MRAANQYAANPEEAQDCFLFVCERLCENGCRRLQQYSPQRGASFQTWLIAVAGNLCVDWHRTVYGRVSMPAAIIKLPELERLVYHYRVEQRQDLESCLFFMRRQFPDLSRARLSKALASVHAALSSKQRWRHTALSQRGTISLDEPGIKDSLAQQGRGPSREAQFDELEAALSTALSRLPPKQRMVLRLRYEQELGLDAVARVAGLRDLHHARRLIQAALKELREQLGAMGFSAGNK
jgi:RNA polymerase sigma factor (sigma-70 family)